MKMTFKLSTIFLTCVLVGCSSGGAGTITTPDGSKFDLSKSPQGTVGADTAYGRIFGQNNANSFYGVWVHNDNRNYKMHYQGTEATRIPRSGSATYFGDAVWMSSGGSSRKGGTTILNVDFDNKTVDGKIEFSLFNDGRAQDITLHTSRLNGAKFSGRASTLLESGTYNGALFGKNASEAAGVAQFSDSSYNAVFGGKRR